MDSGSMAAAAIFAPQVAQAQITRVSGPDTRQSIGVTLGGFFVTREDSRVTGDVLVADLSDVDPLLFEIEDFDGFVISGEWLVGLGDYLEAGVGVGYYQKTVPSIYAFLEHAGRRGNRAGSQAPHRPGDRDRALSPARPTQRRPAVRRRGHRRHQLALQRER